MNYYERGKSWAEIVCRVPTEAPMLHAKSRCVEHGIFSQVSPPERRIDGVRSGD